MRHVRRVAPENGLRESRRAVRENCQMLKDSVYNAIKTKIIIQEMKPGARINEKELMEEYNIGKTPLREVFFRLQRDGLIRRFPRSGTIVSPIDFDELRDAAEIRLSLEGLVGELVAKRITEEEMGALSQRIELLDEYSREGSLNQYVVTESQLHQLMYEATHNNKLYQTITEQQGLFARMWFSIGRTTRDFVPQVKDWRNIYKALQQKNAEKVIQINREHFRTFYNNFKTTLF